LTLITALVCCDGVVMASESQATTSATGTPVKQKTSKIKQCSNSPIIWGAAGDVSVIQKIEKELDRQISQMSNISTQLVVDIVKNAMVGIRQETISRYRGIYGSLIGDRKAPAAVTMVVGYEQSLPTIIIIDQDGEDVDCHEFGYAAIGIGDIFAHSLLHNHKIGDITCLRGQVLAYKVIKEAIEVGAYGLGEPVDVWAIQFADNKPKINHLSQEQINALEDTHDALKKLEINLFKELQMGEPSNTSSPDG